MKQPFSTKQKTFQARQFGPHIFSIKGPLAPKWYIVDATGKTVGRLASTVAKVIIGKHKPEYTTHADVGDFVIITNIEKVKFTGKKWTDKLYRDHSGYVSGLRETPACDMLKRHPEEILRRAVWGMTSHSSLARRQMKKLKLYTGSEHPHKAQNPQELPASVKRRSILES